MGGVLKSRAGDPGLLRIVARGFAIGLAAGFVVALFRLASNALFALLFLRLRHAAPGLVAFFALAALLAVLALIVGRMIVVNPAIQRTGIGVIRTSLRQGRYLNWKPILLEKFAASTLVSGGGMSVGREGPSIQMGAAMGHGLASMLGLPEGKRSPYMITGCAAGLSSAFSAPFTGIFFVFERMRVPLSLSLVWFTLAGAAGAYVMVNRIFGLGQMFPFDALTAPAGLRVVNALIVGAVAGALGLCFPVLVQGMRAVYERQRLLPLGLTPLLPFAGVLLFAFLYPRVLGEGVNVIAQVGAPANARQAVAGGLLLFLVAKAAFTVFCYGSPVPAGVFVPLLCVGAVAGSLLGHGLAAAGLLLPESARGCVPFGMAACFTGAVRAPLTSIVLVLEITGAFACLPGIVLAVLAAFLLTQALRVSLKRLGLTLP